MFGRGEFDSIVRQCIMRVAAVPYSTPLPLTKPYGGGDS